MDFRSELRSVLAARRQRRTGDRRGDQGAVLLIVLMVILALLGVGMTALWMTGGNLQIGANANLRNQALYVAEAGIEAARADLNGPIVRPLPALLAGGLDPAFDNVPTGVDAQGRPNGLGAVYFLPNNALLRDVPFPPAGFNRGLGGPGPASTTMGSYTVWIRNDTGEIRQNNITGDVNNQVVIRSRGLAADGRVEVVLEVTMSPGTGGGRNARACYAGKNSCDDNSSTVAGIYLE